MNKIEFYIYYQISDNHYSKLTCRLRPVTTISKILNALSTKIGCEINTDEWFISGIRNCDVLRSDGTVGYYGIKDGDIIKLSRVGSEIIKFGRDI